MTRFYVSIVVWCLVAVIGCGASNEAPSTSSPSVQAAVAEALPMLSISTNRGVEITSREVYEAGRYTLTSENGQLLMDSTLEIRGRGHSTWDLMPKKPYRLKLTSSTSLLSMPANRHWVLLANYSDKTLMRNDIAFELSRRMGMEYTPRSTYVELQLNGAYRGIYQLVEHVRVGPNRVNIPELNVGDTGPDVISGGYLIEIDSRRGEDFCIESASSAMTFCLSNPDKLLEPGWGAQRAYIEGYIAQTEQAIFSGQFADPGAGYAAYLDVDSAITYYLINEVFKNVDGNLRLSTFLYKKRDGKLTFGPVWDFDLAIGNVNYGHADLTDGWHIRSAPWFRRMFEDPVFEGKVKVRWAQLKANGDLDSLFTFADRRAQWLSKVQVRNFQTWDILGIYVWPNRVVTGAYDREVVAMKDWLRERIAWMDAQLSL
ncbi:MAG: CotH kinase family protein [Nitrospirota bacterium]|nr:CotH kinase family protein [Nitrospirota bacterium]MDP2383567.1 CotH kinase family protein [Nitrospirota bacterium]MDP3597377.1 CotH kinase family protein [Nitrospirota bacterium]